MTTNQQAPAPDLIALERDATSAWMRHRSAEDPKERTDAWDAYEVARDALRAARAAVKGATR